VRDDLEQAKKATWEEQWPEAAELCGRGLERLKEHGNTDPEGLELLKKAASLGYPWGHYKYAISCFYHLNEPKTAFRHFKKSAAAGHLDSLYHLGLLYQKGLASPSRLSKDPSVAEVQIQREAVRCYQEAAEGGHWTAQLNLGLMYLSGMGVGRFYRKAFKLIFSSACQNYPPAMAQLARLYLDECKAGYNLIEAYIWALLEANGEGCKIAEEIEPKLSPAQIHSAQEEVDRRQDILLSKGFLSEEDFVPFTKKKEESPAPPETGKLKTSHQNGGTVPSESPKSAHRSGICLADWNIQKLSELKLVYYLKDKNITFSYRKHKATFPAQKLFLSNCLTLLLMHDKHVNYGEQEVGYYDTTIADQRRNSKRNNRGVVSDFNLEFRKLFGLGKEAKAFEWLPAGPSYQLKSNFHLEVKY